MWAVSCTWNLWEIVSTSNTYTILGFSQGCMWGNRGKSEHRKFWLNMKKKLLPWGWSETGPGLLRDWGISVLGDTKNLTGQSMEQAAVVGSGLSRLDPQSPEFLPNLPHSVRFVNWAKLCQVWFGAGCAIVFVIAEFLHVVFFNADSDPDGESNEPYRTVEDSSHRCVGDSRLSLRHWLDHVFFVPW